MLVGFIAEPAINIERPGPVAVEPVPAQIHARQLTAGDAAGILRIIERVAAEQHVPELADRIRLADAAPEGGAVQAKLEMFGRPRRNPQTPDAGFGM